MWVPETNKKNNYEKHLIKPENIHEPQKSPNKHVYFILFTFISHLFHISFSFFLELSQIPDFGHLPPNLRSGPGPWRQVPEIRNLREF